MDQAISQVSADEGCVCVRMRLRLCVDACVCVCTVCTVRLANVVLSTNHQHTLLNPLQFALCGCDY